MHWTNDNEEEFELKSPNNDKNNSVGISIRVVKFLSGEKYVPFEDVKGIFEAFRKYEALGFKIIDDFNMHTEKNNNENKRR